MAEIPIGKDPKSSVNAGEDMDLEFYALRDEALKRVAIKGSVKIHLAVWGFLNAFFLFLNLVSTNFQISSLSDFWAFWTIFAWGLGLYIHATAWLTINVINIGKRIFYVHGLIAIGLIPFLAAINVLTMPTYLWFWWALIAEIVFLLLHYYITFISTTQRIEQAIQREMKRIQALKDGENPK